jgi:hypothetical protein
MLRLRSKVSGPSLVKSAIYGHLSPDLVPHTRAYGSALNRTYTLYGLGVHYVQAEGGEPGITACVARADPV